MADVIDLRVGHRLYPRVPICAADAHRPMAYWITQIENSQAEQYCVICHRTLRFLDYGGEDDPLQESGHG